MGRGVSSGGGQSSLGYLFGSDEPPKAQAALAPTGPEIPPAFSEPSLDAGKATPSSATKPDIAPVNPNIPAGTLGNNQNNYHRADGQNTGNFITDRPSTKVHSAPGGGSSLGYLFGGGEEGGN